MIADFMHQHHDHCDRLFVAAEGAVHAGSWDVALGLYHDFVADVETHFRAEEEVLFPAFEQATGTTMGPTQVMRMEHAQMRQLFAQMHAAVGMRDAGGYAGAAETLLVLMQQHNMKEENILYPMCDRTLADASVLSSLQGRLGAQRTACVV